jgi:hypothetical protein
MLRPEQSESKKLWDDFTNSTFPMVRKLQFQNIPKQSALFAVYICQESHPHTEYVLRNVMHFLGPAWGLQVIAWPNLRKFVEDIVGDWRDVFVVDIKEDITYKEVVTRKYFWDALKGESQLLFDIDSLLCHGDFDEFLQYDYIAAPWTALQAVSPKCQIGSGGLSLRKKAVMIEICETCNPRPVGREDVYFSVNLHLNADKYRLPTLETAQRFAVECLYHPKPLGLHKPWSCLSAEQLDSLLSNIDYSRGSDSRPRQT